ncbi:MAG: metallophosphoesterase family protein [Spirochaetes bacterium]|nr:metallophosphoesterase family protein [Spirochaetota bacterium]
MRYAVISDLHMGSEEFEQNLRGFERFLDHLERRHDEIILLGDVFETYYPVFPWGALGEYRRHRRRYDSIASRFFSPPYALLSGNHDAVLGRRLGVPHETERRHGPLRILFTHGHLYERTFRNPLFARFAETYMWLGYRLKKLGLPGLYEAGFRYDHEMNVRDGGMKYIRGAREAMARHSYDIVVTAHTHDEKYLVFDDGRVYLNCGDCMTRKMYAAIDTERRDCSLNYYDDGRVTTLREARPWPACGEAAP